MLYLLRCVRIARFRPKPLHPGVGDSVQKDNGGFHKFSRDRISDGRNVPRPPQLRVRAEEASEGEEAVTPKDSTLWDGVGQRDITKRLHLFFLLMR